MKKHPLELNRLAMKPPWPLGPPETNGSDDAGTAAERHTRRHRRMKVLFAAADVVEWETEIVKPAEDR